MCYRDCSSDVCSSDLSSRTPTRRSRRRSSSTASTAGIWRDRKSTRLNSSHGSISYAAFCLKKNLNTPAGFLPTLNHPTQRPDITRWLEPLGENQRGFPVGRLDFNSSGLILFFF